MQLLLGAIGNVDQTRIAENIAHSRSLGLPSLAPAETGRGTLNIVGRGPSILQHYDDLQASGFETWSVGSAYRWCRYNHIEATALCVDPSPAMAKYLVNANRAIVSDQCDPTVFAALLAAETDIRLIDPEQIAHGTTAATFAPELGLTMGHSEIRFYGCESSFADWTHVDGNIPTPHLLRVECAGELFLTNPQMLLQARELWELFATHHEIFIDLSGGLLGAMIRSHGAHEVVAASREFIGTLEPVAPMPLEEFHKVAAERNWSYQQFNP